MFRPNSTAGYQPDIKAFCTPDIMSHQPLDEPFYKCIIQYLDFITEFMLFFEHEDKRISQNISRQ